MPSSTERCRVALFGMKFDLWKKSKEECNSNRRDYVGRAQLQAGNQIEWHTLELQQRFRERTRAEDFGLLMMCYRSLSLGGGAHVLRSSLSLSSTRQMIPACTTQQDSLL